MLVWQDGEAALLGYNDPRELADRYDVDHPPRDA
jgi:hypothetical protein